MEIKGEKRNELFFASRRYIDRVSIRGYSGLSSFI